MDATKRGGEKLKRESRAEEAPPQDDKKAYREWKKEHDKFMEERVKQKELERLADFQRQQNLKQFYCVAFVVAAVVLLYFYVKFRVEGKGEYLI